MIAAVREALRGLPCCRVLVLPPPSTTYDVLIIAINMLRRRKFMISVKDANSTVTHATTLPLASPSPQLPKSQSPKPIRYLGGEVGACAGV